MSVVENPEALSAIPLFENLSLEDLTRLNSLLRRKIFPAGTNIITIDQPGELVYILLDETVKIYVDQRDGSEVILAFLGPGDTFGEMSLVDSARRSANVLTLERSSCLMMDRQAFDQCLRATSELAYNLVRLLSRRLRLANEQVQALSTLDVRGRVARQIVAFADQYGQPDPENGIRIPLRLTQSDLASLVGASRERVNKVVVDFKESGFISVEPSHHLTVRKLQALVDRCQ